jgi:hypothetical protein
MIKRLFAYFLIILLSYSCSGKYTVKYEEPSYMMIEKEDKFELRKYDAYLVAATEVEGSFDDVGNEGFRRLFKYISGDNVSRQNVSMTVPVSQKTVSEKISMTSPVNQKKTGDKWEITFMLPSQYSIDMVPDPLDERITIKEIPSRLMAVMKYSGTWSRKRYLEHEGKLNDIIRARGLKALSEPVFARYNPPFTPWFLRRNEIHIHVEQSN